MLQEATKILSKAFTDSFIKKLCLYLHDCVREEVKSSTFRNLNQDKDNKWVFLSENDTLLTAPDKPLALDGTDTEITELMVQAEISQKDRYLIYGYLFLKGKSSKKKKSEEFLTPLLYMPCRLERNGLNIDCNLTEENLSLNTGALAGLMKQDDEDEVEHMFEGLIDVIPDLPLTDEKLQIFITTLKSLIPDIKITEVDNRLKNNLNTDTENSSSSEDDSDTDDYVPPKDLSVVDTSAIILTKRPTITAGVLHELTQMAEKPNGVFRETALAVIQEEYTKNSKTKPFGGNSNIDNSKAAKPQNVIPITPLELSDSQRQVIEGIQNFPLLAVYGPPGTGKSQTIVNLVAHLVASGKTVLVASRMDKAVDVVSERLNGLGAPFLCLRAGRANYQKQLNFQLQDLLSNKVDLDSDFESSVLTDPKDLENLVKNKQEIEEKCEKIIKLESEWNEALKIYKKHSEAYGETDIIQSEPTKIEIESNRALLDRVESTLEKAGLINSIIKNLTFRDLKKKLNLKDTSCTRENIDLIRLGLLMKELKGNLKAIESGISKIGNLHLLLETIKDLRQKQKLLSVDILKNQRREALKALTRDQIKRQRLIIHSKALVERKKNLQNRLLHEEDFTPLLEAFPCWAVTTYAVSESLPLKPGLFDVAIIDEASQCDIASCFPVMFRAKKAVIVGDDKQLPHLSFLEKAKEQSFLSQHNIPDRYQLMWRFRTNSMFDLANFYSSYPTLLDEHFRSLAPIINFSNQEFYGNRIRVMSREIAPANCIELVVVDDAKADLDNTRNMAEVEEIMKRIQDIAANDSPKYGQKPVSIGVISPFRGQVELVKKAVSQIIPDEVVRKHQIEVGTAHTFQGDEKDIILLSFTLAPNSHHQSLTFAQKPNLFNVAITRARKKLICFISRRPESLPQGILRSYLEYIEQTNKKAISIQADNYQFEVQKEIAELLKEEGLTVTSSFESAGFLIDLVVSIEDKTVAVMLDGFEGKKASKEVWKQSILERCGWNVMRITAREWSYSKKVCIDRVKQALC